MTKDKLVRSTALYASLIAAFTFTALTTIFAWVTNGCAYAESFFENQAEKYRS